MKNQGEQILIVGGYGAVGRILATELADAFPGQVIAAWLACNPSWMTRLIAFLRRSGMHFWDLAPSDEER